MKMEGCLAYSKIKERCLEPCGYAPAYEGEGEEELVCSFSDLHSYYVLEHGAKQKDFDAYCEKLVSCGFEQYCAHASNQNRFATYTNGESIISLSHISYRDTDRYTVCDVSYLLISVDSTQFSALPPKCDRYQTVTTVQLTTDGSFFIIRLVDGRFLVIDSNLNRPNPIELIYATLCEQNPLDGKPVVAAWMITHAHSDHVDALLALLEKYGDGIEIESLIQGFPGEESYVGKNYVEYDMDKESSWLTKRSRRLCSLLAQKMPHVKFVTAHIGQIFEYPEARVEIVFTAENLYRQQMIDTNMSSVVYKLTLPGGSLLALGDAVDLEARIIRKIHSADLMCDMVILAHHALNGGDTELYCNTGAKAAIWPNDLESVLAKSWKDHYMLNHFDPQLVKHNFIISRNDRVMTFYDGMSAEEIARFDRRIDAPAINAPDFAKRKQPKTVLTDRHLAQGFGLAPRFYGVGEDAEEMTVDQESKTYTLTFYGVTEYNYDDYCNTLKRDGYLRTDRMKTDSGIHSVHASPQNAVFIDFNPSEAKMTVTVGGIGKDVLAVKSIHQG